MNRIIIIIISISLIIVLAAGCSSTVGSYDQKSEPPTDSNAFSGANDSNGNNPFEGIFDILDADYNRNNRFIQTSNGIVYYNKNNTEIYSVDSETGQLSPIINDRIIVCFAVHKENIYFYSQPSLFRVPINGGDAVVIETNYVDTSLQIVNMGIIQDTLYMTVATSENSDGSPPYMLFSSDLSNNPDVLSLISLNINSINGLPYSNGLFYSLEPVDSNDEIARFNIFVRNIYSDERKEISQDIYNNMYLVSDKYIFFIDQLRESDQFVIKKTMLDGSEETVFIESADIQMSFLTYDDAWIYYELPDKTNNKSFLYRFNQETGEIQEICGLTFEFYGVVYNYIYGYDFDTKDMVRISLPF